MQNRTTRRVFGIVLIVIAAASLLLSLVGVVGIWMIRQPFIAGASSAVKTLADTLDTTNQALQVVSSSLQTASQALDTVDRSTLQISRALSDTQITLGSFSSLLSKDLPASISATGTALRSAQSSARVIDDVLGGLSRVPLIGLQYKPDVPLNTSLGNVANSLDSLPGTITGLGRNLSTAADDIGSVAASVGEVSRVTAQMRRNVSDAQAVAAGYRTEVGSLQKLTASVNASLPPTITAIALALTFAIFWLSVVQAMVLLTGIAWMRGARV